MAFKGFKVEKIDGIVYRVYPTGTKVIFKKPKPKVYKYKAKPCVYRVIDKTTGKIYIGSTNNMRNRINGYKDRDLQKDIFKGLKAEDLHIEVLEYCHLLSKKDRLYLEYQYIISNDCIHPKGNNKLCPLNNVVLCNIDLSTYNPLSYVPDLTKGQYDKDRYQRNKDKISLQRKARYQAKKQG